MKKLLVGIPLLALTMSHAMDQSKAPTFVNLLIQKAQSLHQKGQNQETSSEIDDAQPQSSWKPASVSIKKPLKPILGHISFDHRWGKVHLQLKNCTGNGWTLVLPRYHWRRHTFNRTEELAARLNELFCLETIQKNLTVYPSRQTLQETPQNVKLYSARINIKLWQEFFFELMPWYYKNPHLYAASLAAVTSIATWYIVSKK